MGRLLVSLSALVGFLVLSSCGGDNSATQPTKSPPQPASSAGNHPVPRFDLCSLITQSEIEQITGSSVGELTEESPTTSGSVTFYSCRSDDLHIDIEAWSNEDDAASSFELGTEYREVGDMGVPAKTTQPLGDLDVLAGQFVVTVDLFTSQDPPDQLEAAKKIARLVIGRLP